MGLDAISSFDIVQRNDVTKTNVTSPIAPVEADLSDIKSDADYKLKFYKELNLSEKEQIQFGIKQTAEKTGVSEEYLKHVLIHEEKLCLTVYDDGVKYNENDPHGTYTVGYGHAKTILGKYIDSPLYEPDIEYPITDENKDLIVLTIPEAFEILQADIEKAKSKAKSFFDESYSGAFDKAPKSIQEAIIDIVFNKGIEEPFLNKVNSPTYFLKYDLANEDYLFAALHTIYQTHNAGLKRRNMYRFLHAVRDLEKTDKQKALESIEAEKIRTSQALKDTGWLGNVRESMFSLFWSCRVKDLGL